MQRVDRAEVCGRSDNARALGRVWSEVARDKLWCVVAVRDDVRGRRDDVVCKRKVVAAWIGVSTDDL